MWYQYHGCPLSISRSIGVGTFDCLGGGGGGGGALLPKAAKTLLTVHLVFIQQTSSLTYNNIDAYTSCNVL